MPKTETTKNSRQIMDELVLEIADLVTKILSPELSESVFEKVAELNGQIKLEEYRRYDV